MHSCNIFLLLKQERWMKYRSFLHSDNPRLFMVRQFLRYLRKVSSFTSFYVKCRQLPIHSHPEGPCRRRPPSSGFPFRGCYPCTAGSRGACSLQADAPQCSSVASPASTAAVTLASCSRQNCFILMPNLSLFIRNMNTQQSQLRSLPAQ